MLNMTLDHKSPLNHRPIQQGESASTKCENKDSQERATESISRDAPESTSDSCKMATSEDEAANP